MGKSATHGVQELPFWALLGSVTLSHTWGLRRGHPPHTGLTPALHLCCGRSAQDSCTLGFTYLSGQPIFLSEAFANSLGTIGYSGLVKDL